MSRLSGGRNPFQSSHSVPSGTGLTFSEEPLSCLWHGKAVELKGKPVRFLQLLAARGRLKYSEIHQEIWGIELSEVVNARRKQLNQIHSLAKRTRECLGLACLSQAGETYVLHSDQIQLSAPRNRVSEGVSRGKVFETGTSITGLGLRDLLYGSKIERGRTILLGCDPLRDVLLLASDRFLDALLRGRDYWIVASSGEDVAVSLARLARAVTESDRKKAAVREHLRVIVVSEEIEYLTLVLEERGCRFVVSSDSQAAFLEKVGEPVMRSINCRLGTYGVQQRGPVVRELMKSEGAASFENRFRSACGTQDGDRVDDLVECWLNVAPAMNAQPQLEPRKQTRRSGI